MISRASGSKLITLLGKPLHYISTGVEILLDATWRDICSIERSIRTYQLINMADEDRRMV